MKPPIVIISPALADANNGNWQTARRWASFLRHQARVSVARTWDGSACAAMIALHARRSADSIARYAASGSGGLGVVLTGTDLYRDIRGDASAQRSLELADRLVVLQPSGLDELSARHRAKAVVIVQSAPALRAGRPRQRTFDLLLVAHLRAEKDPMTAARALARLEDPTLRLVHIGAIGDRSGGSAGNSVGADFVAAAGRDPRIELHGALPHAATRQLIKRARILLLPSRMEGGANVIVEAVRSGVPVIASRIGGSVGLLGADYPGLFPVGDDAALAELIWRTRNEAGFLAGLRRHCEQRGALFDPERERDAVRALAHNLVFVHHASSQEQEQ
ncbi:MAG: TIGR04348 family glycosyltransferase [Burkholderiaceae bacterium]|nr:TIGR04348 family glycosyltransferase [Burkholderiaceae bacterium]